jgi:hypothetical protein
MPPSLSLIETEARQLIRRMPESRQRALQAALMQLCEDHWRSIRGKQPLTRLAQTLWAITPPLTDLFIDLYAKVDTRLLEMLPEPVFTRGLALLVLTEIERGNEAAVHLAHEPMMAFESMPPSTDWLVRNSALLRGTLEPPLIHPHDKHGVLWRALAAIAAQTRRLDLPAIREVIRLLSESVDPHAMLPDADLDSLRHAVAQAGIRFLAVEDDHIRFSQHEREHEPVRTRQVGELLQELRQRWLD